MNEKGRQHLEIKVPTTKMKYKPSDCAGRALAAFLGKKRCFPFEANAGKYQIRVDDEYTYYPYWIGTVWTRKERAIPVYPAKEIIFYAVTDGISGNFIVLRNVPKTRGLECPDNKVLPARISEKKLMNEVLSEAITDRINRQFIFGMPESRKGQSNMIHLPMTRVQIKRNEDQGDFKEYYVNTYTGEVKTV
jgi:hypothetical protein